MSLVSMAYQRPPQCYQPEGGWRQEAFQSPELLQVPAASSPRKHKRVWSDPLVPSHPAPERYEGYDGNKQSMERMPSTMIQIQAPVNGSENVLSVNATSAAADTVKPQGDTALYTNKSANHRLKVENPVLRQPSFKPPISVFQPPEQVKRSTSTSLLRSAHVSLDMEHVGRAPAEATSQVPLEIYGDFERLETVLDSRAGHITQNHPLFETEWPHIRSLRSSILSLRSKIHEIRSVLRHKENAKSTALDILFQHFRIQELGLLSEHDGLAKSEKTITELMRDFQNAMDEYGPMEDDCTELENKLSRKESKLSRLEDRFYQQWQGPLGLGQTEPDIRSLTSSSCDEDDGLESHPLVNRFLSKLGDLDILREQLDELVEEAQALEREKKSRLRFGLSLAPEDETFLDHSQEAKDELFEEIRLAEAEVEILKQECRRNGLVDEDGEPTDFQTQERGTFIEEEDVDPRGQISEYVKYPLLLPQPGSKKVDLCNYAPELVNCTAGRINHWLLDRLRSSALDVNLLARTFECKVGEINDSWQGEVLSFWYEDGTVTAASGFQVYTSSLTTQEAPLSQQSPINPDHENENRSYRLFLRSS